MGLLQPARGRAILGFLSLVLIATTLVGAPAIAIEEVPASGTTSSIAGTVTDATTSAPIEGICVFLYREDVWESVPNETTASDGTYRFDGLSSGYYTISFSGCGSTYGYERFGDDEYGRTVYIEIGDAAVDVTGVDADMVASGGEVSTQHITGTVMLPVGYDVGSVCLFAYDVTESGQHAQSRVDLLSLSLPLEEATPVSYDITLWGSSDRYVVEAVDCLYATYRSLYAADQPGASTLLPAEATSIAPATTGIDFDLVEANLLTGTVRSSADGSPVPGACLSATPTMFDPGWTYTGPSPDGTFQVAGLTGTHRLMVEDCSETPRYVSLFTTQEIPAAGPVDITLDPGAQMSGTVTGPDGSAFESACLNLHGDQAYGYGYSAADGSYTTSPMVLGTYTVDIDFCNQFDFVAPTTGQVDVVDADSDGIPDDLTRNWQLSAGAGLRYDAPSDEGCVTLQHTDGTYLDTWPPFYLLHTGRWLAEGIAAGTYDVTIGCRTPVVYEDVQFVAGEIYDLADGTVAPTPDEGWTVSGTITDGNAGDAPIAELPLQLCSDTSSGCRYGQTNEAGAFAFPEAADGSYTLLAHLPGESAPREVPVTVAGADVDASTSFALPTGGVTGTVVAKDGGAPQADTWVFACPAAGDGRCFDTITDGSGQFTLTGMSDRDYTVGIHPAGGFTSTNRTATITGGAVTDLGTIEVTAPTPPPSGYTVNDSTEGEVPTTVIGSPTPMQVPDTCPGPVTFQLLQDGTPGQFVQNGETVTTGSMTQNAEAEQWEAEFTTLFAGPAEVVVDADGTDCDVSFSIYIDPSGYVVDETGEGIAGAEVTLLRAELEDGPFEVVPDGSTIMSSANRANPDTTDGTGHFGWDVASGFYKVQATAVGCVDPENGDDTVESAV